MGLLDKLLGRRVPQPEAGPAPADDQPVIVNAYATVRDLPPLDFAHMLNGHRDLSDPELAEHLRGFIGYVRSRDGDGKSTARYHLLRHIQRVRHNPSFSVVANEIAAIADWARAANAILFLPDGSVRAPNGAVLMNQAGERDPDAVLPYPPDAIARRERTLARLAGMDPKPLAGMPPVLGEAETVLRPAEAVLRRALALACVAVHAEAIDTGKADIRPRLRESNPLGMASLTPNERAFVEADAPDETTVIQMYWRYEALNTLLWALEHPAASVERSDVAADPATLSRAALELAQDAGATARLRPIPQVLDALDRTWREHWIVRQGRQIGVQPKGLNPDVLMERHNALNWLTGFHNDPGTAWDDVDTPT